MKKIIAIVLTLISILGCFGIISGAEDITCVDHEWSDGYIATFFGTRNGGVVSCCPLYCYECEKCGKTKCSFGTSDDVEKDYDIEPNDITLDYSIEGDNNIISLNVILENATGFESFGLPISYDDDIVKPIGVKDGEYMEYFRDKNCFIVSAYNTKFYCDILGKSFVLSAVVTEEPLSFNPFSEISPRNMVLFTVRFMILDVNTEKEIAFSCGGETLSINLNKNDEIKNEDEVIPCEDEEEVVAEDETENVVVEDETENVVVEEVAEEVVEEVAENEVKEETEEGNENIFNIGDVDGDNKITVADARLCLRRDIGLENYEVDSIEYFACDIDEDNEVTVADARLILRKSIGL